jgi:hypothetical protein
MRPAEGLFAPPRRVDAIADLLANVWQFGYVTNDLDGAIAFMSERFGLEHCLKLPAGGATFLVGDEPAEWDAKFAMGARGGKIIELIEPVAGHIDFSRGFYRRTDRSRCGSITSRRSSTTARRSGTGSARCWLRRGSRSTTPC